jgi:hypothetical protein
VKKKAPATCAQCGTKLNINDKCPKANRCEPFKANHDSLIQRMRDLDKGKR